MASTEGVTINRIKSMSTIKVGLRKEEEDRMIFVLGVGRAVCVCVCVCVFVLLVNG
jgi:hypothetical protein